MANHSLYRKYRPQTFLDVVGQEHIEQTLRNALANDRVSHAYLFCGPRGTGKTTTARLLAKALLCDQAPTANPDGVCENCRDIAEGLHPDVYELDAASRTGVDNVREEIIGRVAFSPTRGRYKVYIIDEVHMLSTAAFNALLKTLEEPPAHVVFVLCTTDPQKVPATIISRCQRFDFHSLSTEQITECLRLICEGEDFRYEPEALELIAKQARGGMRDAITALEQVAVFGNGSVGYAAAENMFGDVGSLEMADIVDLVIARDAAGCFRWVDSFAQGGIDVVQVARSLTSYVRNLYVASLRDAQGALPPMNADARSRLLDQADRIGSPDRAAAMLMVLGDLSTELRTSVDARLSLEIALTRLAHPAGDLTLESLAARLDALERGGVAAAPADAAAAPWASSASLVEPRREASAAEPASVATPPQAPVAEPAAPVPAATEPEPAPAGAQPASGGQAPRSDEEIIRHAVSLLKDPSSLRRLWDIAVRDASKNFPALSILTGGAKPHADLKRSRIVVELPHDAVFAKGMLSQADSKQEMMLQLQKLFGVKLGVEYVLGEPSGEEPVPAAAEPAVASPSPQPAPAPTPAPVPAAIDEGYPEVESVPVSAYDGFADAAPAREPERRQSWDGPAAQPQPEARPEPQPQPAAKPEPEAQPAPQPQPAVQPQSEAQPQPVAQEQQAAPAAAPEAAPSATGDSDFAADVDLDTQDLFRSVFGDGVVFRNPEE